ncbi:hypothetical protein D5S17_21240 [Pseudonocardiaceae bacterium YIM PH 21723]|nr:hypothetical protein D5S17_21240 [Pseudonocardiaceae bacterium YIM PH 21723]
MILPLLLALTTWLHDDSYVSAGKATSYVDAGCPRGEHGWTLTVRLTAAGDGRTATGSRTVPLTCRGELEQQVVEVRPDGTPFFGNHDKASLGVAEVRDPHGTITSSSTKRMHFYAWN